MAELGTFETLLAEVGKALLPLKAALASPERFYGLMLKLGWRADTIPQPLQQLGTGLNTLFTELRGVVGGGLSVSGSVSLSTNSASGEVSADAILRLGNALKDTIEGINDIASAPDAAFPASLQADNFKDIISTQLVDYLLIEYLRTYQAPVAFALRALGVIKSTYVPAGGNRPPHLAYSIDFSDLPTVFENPGVVLENAFGWGSNDFDFGRFASQVDNLLTRVGADVFTEVVPDYVSVALDAVPGPTVPRRKALKVVFFERKRPSGSMAAQIKLLSLPRQGSHKPGIALLPAFNGVLDFKMQAGPDIALVITSDLDLQGGVGLMIRPGEPIDVVLGFEDGAAPTHATGSIRVAVERSHGDDTPTLLLGKPDGTRLQYVKIGGAGGVSLDPSGQVDVFAEFETNGLEFVFKPDESDGFIQSFFPGDGAGVGFDLALGVSYLQGFYFRGASYFEIAVPAHIQIGPLDLQSMTIGIRLEAGEIPIDLGITFKLELGPLTAVVENIGVRATFTFPDDKDGNLGPLDLTFGFKPPNGVGLVVDAGIVKGGGYLFFDTDKEEYAGALELVFSGVINLKAIGLLTTRMPDGSKGFSLLLIITAEFGTGIQLGYGFVLLGVGGLLGLNRTMKLQPLMEGIRTGAVESIMFPEDVIANAPKIISDLRTIFPPLVGIFLIGPMAKLGWGTPALITVSLGIIIEVPGNIAILGIIKVALPADEIAILVLQVNFAGAIEFDKKRLYFFAALFESRILFITIEGELGLLVAWGDDANFVLSVGGFHPRFTPPPLPFPSPRRIAISLINTSVARVRIEGYFAITSNTVQFGARVELFFGLSVLNVKGHLAFDALFQFSPFFFIIEISASFSVNVFGAGLFSVYLRGSLEGPTPWRASGEGSISVLFFEISVDFETTWGESRDTMLPPIAVMPLFKTEFEKAENWRALLPEGADLLVSLRPLPPASTDLVLHPVGVLRVTQRRLPLELTLDKVGNQKPSDVQRLSVAVAAGGLAKVADTFEQFAPGQFKNMKDGDKLSSPGYGDELAGLDLSAAGSQLASSRMVKRIVRYEEIILDSNFKRFRRRFTAFAGGLFEFFLGGAAITKSDLSQRKKTQLQPFTEKVTVTGETYVVASKSTNQAHVGTARGFTSVASAREYMARQVASDPTLAGALHVIPGYEEAA
jgi:hypothetical protein